MIGFIAFVITLLVLAVPTAVMIASDLAHDWGQYKRDRMRRSAKLKIDAIDRSWN